MCDHNYYLWHWNPHVVTIDQMWLNGTLNSVEVKDFSTPDTEIQHENSMNIPDILKELQTIFSNEIQPENWIAPIPIDIP